MLIEAILLMTAAAKQLYKSCPIDKKKSFVNNFEKKNAVKTSDRDSVLNSLDGKFLSCKDCGANGACGSTESGKPSAPSAGKRPTGSKGKGCTATNLKKVVFVNGILNSPQDNCNTSKKLANTLCSEVVSFYNASDGVKGDLSECIKNVRNQNNEPARALEQYLQNHKGEDITIVAHSQGGLITRQALNSMQADMIQGGASVEEASTNLSKIKVISCGTAENGWPAGPSYEQFTNRWDPVPKAIAEADEIYNPGPVTGRAPADQIVRNKFISSPALSTSGVIGHGMDDIYMPKIAKKQKNVQPVNNCLTCDKQTYISSGK